MGGSDESQWRCVRIQPLIQVGHDLMVLFDAFYEIFCECDGLRLDYLEKMEESLLCGKWNESWSWF